MKNHRLRYDIASGGQDVRNTPKSRAAQVALLPILPEIRA